MKSELTRDQLNQVLEALDIACSEVDADSFGIPLHDAPHRAYMREALIDALGAAKVAE